VSDAEIHSLVYFVRAVLAHRASRAVALPPGLAVAASVPLAWYYGVGIVGVIQVPDHFARQTAE